MGWSMGGLISLQAAMDFPQRIERLVLVASNPSFVTREHWPEGVDEWVFRDFARDLKTDFQGTLNRFLLLETMGSDTARESLRRLKADLHNGHVPDIHALRSGLSILQDSDYTGQLAGIDQRTLWLAGGRDKLVPPAAMKRAAGMMPAGVFQRLPGAGHAPFIGHADEFVRQVETFLKGESET
jgi:pimeloyl-[acyl-carrier protein] methyl ester esterase